MSRLDRYRELLGLAPASYEPVGKSIGRFYGDGTTIHHNGEISVETHEGTVIAVWFRCQRLPFTQTQVDARRVGELSHDFGPPPIVVGVQVLDPVE